MPPAFVLSQDQTLRKKNFLSEIPIQAIYLRSTLKKNFSRFTSHYSIFNQPALEGQRVLNISSSAIFSNRFLKIFRTFFISPATRSDLKQSVTGRKTSFNIAPRDHFASRFLPFFEKFSEKGFKGFRFKGSRDANMADVGNSQRPSCGSSGETLTRTQTTDRKTNAVGPVEQAGPVERTRLTDARLRRGKRSGGAGHGDSAG